MRRLIVVILLIAAWIAANVYFDNALCESVARGELRPSNYSDDICAKERE